ncbi:hypothetical protein P4O66_004596 [Electrophorus voltai]|uniref:Uncharacterized protein n=1 Tax=Electrophorus voltai TaxID=2609070 RepID=A0AAD8ZLC2_9TELE|nr:hypothetical protein P4O66_004596 [Electrophorus voltai]
MACGQPKGYRSYGGSRVGPLRDSRLCEGSERFCQDPSGKLPRSSDQPVPPPADLSSAELWLAEGSARWHARTRTQTHARARSKHPVPGEGASYTKRCLSERWFWLLANASSEDQLGQIPQHRDGVGAEDHNGERAREHQGASAKNRGIEKPERRFFGENLTLSL